MSDAFEEAELARQFGVGIADRVSKHAMAKLAPRIHARAGFRMPSAAAINAAMDTFGKEAQKRIGEITERELRSPGPPESEEQVASRLAALENEFVRVGTEIASRAARSLD